MAIALNTAQIQKGVNMRFLEGEEEYGEPEEEWFDDEEYWDE